MVSLFSPAESKKLWRYGAWLVDDQGRAADVIPEALIKAFDNLQSFDVKKIMVFQSRMN